MERATDDDDFIAAPVGRYLTGDGFVVWCVDSRFGGSALGSNLGPVAAARLFALAKRRAASGPTSLVSDLSRLTVPTPEVFASLLEHASADVSRLDAQLVRHALIVSPSLGGLASGGLMALAGATHSLRPFTDARAAFAWASDRADSDSIERTVDALVTAHFEQGDLGVKLRHLIREQLPNASLATVAEAMKISTRSLQRELGRAGLSFRVVLGEVRLQRARELVVESEDKVEAIALAVGYDSPSAFARAFHQAFGESPHDWRVRTRSSR